MHPFILIPDQTQQVLKNDRAYCRPHLDCKAKHLSLLAKLLHRSNGFHWAKWVDRLHQISTDCLQWIFCIAQQHYSTCTSLSWHLCASLASFACRDRSLQSSLAACLDFAHTDSCHWQLGSDGSKQVFCCSARCQTPASHLEWMVHLAGSGHPEKFITSYGGSGNWAQENPVGVLLWELKGWICFIYLKLKWE